MSESVLKMFSHSVARFPHKKAIECFGRSVTYADLEMRSDQLARLLIASGVERGSPVAIISDDQIQVINSILAVLKSGGVFMPLDPATPENRLRAALGVTEARWFISDSKYIGKISEITSDAKYEARVISLDRLSRDADLDSEHLQVFHYDGSESVAGFPSPIRPDEMCYVFFTSGSTGEPKAIAGQMKGISHFVNWEIETFAIDETARVSQLTTPSFDAILRDIFTPLAAGGAVCIPPARDIVINSSALVSWVDGQGITLLHCVPSVFRAILNYDLNSDYFKALRYVLLSGEPTLPYDVKRWAAIFGDRIQLVNLYGPSETTMTKLFYMVRPSDADRKFVPIGKPMEGAEALVLDNSGRPRGVGEIGEIYIRTAFRTLGYYNRPGLTNDVFIMNPLTNDPEDIVYKTGDLGRLLEDADLEYLGRLDRQVKIRGVRIELAEVENVLLQHDRVRDAAVIDRKGDEGGNYLCAYVVLSEEARAEEITGFLAQHLPSVMIPTIFIMLDKLPRTISGKLNRALLPAPNQAGARKTVPYVAPCTPMEHAMARIWSDVLQISSPGITENFFTIGGHSLLVMEVFSRVEGTLGAKIALQDFLANPTIKALAEKAEMAILEQASSDDDPSDSLEDFEP